MILLISRIISLITLIFSFFSIWKKKKNVRIKEIAPISNIFLIGAIFDLMIMLFQSEAQIRMLGIIYCFVFPISLLVVDLIIKLEYFVFPMLLITICSIVIYLFKYDFLNSLSVYCNFPIILLQIITILFIFYKSISFKIKLKPLNYFYYLIMGFLILDFLYYLGNYEVVNFDRSIWMKFIFLYVFYLNFIRLIYIFYVVKFN